MNVNRCGEEHRAFFTTGFRPQSSKRVFFHPFNLKCCKMLKSDSILTEAELRREHLKERRGKVLWAKTGEVRESQRI